MMNSRLRALFYFGLHSTLLAGAQAFADGSSIGKVYDPYVDQLGTEVELEYLDHKLQQDVGSRSYRLGLGLPVANMLFAEFSILAEDNGGQDGSNDSLEIEGYEAELKWQLSEQGEYAADFGLLFELERESDLDYWELSTVLLASKDFGRITGTANVALNYESIAGRPSEWETLAALQARYRWRQGFEPALEYFKSENTHAIGPVISGLMRIGAGKKLHWELGILWELEDNPVDKTLKARLEYEF